MAVQFYIGDLLTGRRIQILPDVKSGSWSEKLNAADELSCTVPLGDPVIHRMNLFNSAAVGKTFLAAVSEDSVLAAGPIWDHEYSADGETLTLTAAGMWTYFDHRVLLPVLVGLLPTDPAADTSLVSSLQGIARELVAQAQAWTGGEVPVILPAEIPGAHERNYKGSDLPNVGTELKRLTQVEGGPDIKFVPRFTTDRLGFEWVMQIGTETEPLIFGTVEPTFNVGLAESSVSALRVKVSGKELASQAFAKGGRSENLVTVSNDSTLTDAAYPLLEVSDTSHASVSEEATVQGYSDELVVRGRAPWMTISFDHQTAIRPFLSAFNVGDFCILNVREDAYLPTGPYRARLVSRWGNEVSDKVSLGFNPEVL